MDETYSVELRSLTKRFEAIVAVDNVSLDIREGEFLTLLGPSGCGKTTTLRMIAGFEQPDEGEIVIQGERMGRRPPFQRNVNTVFQNYALFPHLDIFGNVAFGLRMRGVPKREQAERVGEALRLVRLSGYGNRRSHQLSGGEQQRVALARALVNHPAVLLLDEPLGALDLKLRRAMQLELKSLNREVGITFIYVTHDQEEALVMSDRIAVMSRGRVLQVGTATEIYERPNSRFVADFIGESNFLFGRLEEVLGDTATVTIEGAGVLRAVAPAAPLERNAAITLAVRPEKMAFVNGTAPPGLNVMTGIVVEVVYRGEDTEYRVNLQGGASVRVRAANQGGLFAVRPCVVGEEVHVAWMPESGTVLGD